jgi:carbonic anhydrase/acetyltransferase-like protein (isoleucine patch superfamily)
MSLHAFEGTSPSVPGDGSAYVAPGAQLIGDVRLAPRASVWFNAVLRGDNEPILIGAGSNVQDGCVLHTDPGFPLATGADVTIGHLAIVHGSEIGDGSLVGMGAMVMNGARIGRGCLIGAGALVTEGKEIPDGALVIGRPGKVVRTLSEEEIAGLRRNAETYKAKIARYHAGLGAPRGAGTREG